MIGPRSLSTLRANDAESRRVVNSDALEGEPEFCWGQLAARVVHPVDVQIIEAFQWIDEPLSTADLAQLFEGKRSWAALRHHVRRLFKLDAIELAEAPTTRDVTKVRYCLKRRGWRDGC